MVESLLLFFFHHPLSLNENVMLTNPFNEQWWICFYFACLLVENCFSTKCVCVCVIKTRIHFHSMFFLTFCFNKHEKIPRVSILFLLSFNSFCVFDFFLGIENENQDKKNIHIHSCWWWWVWDWQPKTSNKLATTVCYVTGI